VLHLLVEWEGPYEKERWTESRGKMKAELQDGIVTSAGQLGSSAETWSAERAALNQLWDLATIEVILARRAYIELTSNFDGGDPIISAAWLRLWRAEERQRQVSAQLEILLAH
jgi:hypothetical protein